MSILHDLRQDKGMRTAIRQFISGLCAFGMGYVSQLLGDSQVMQALITGLLFPLLNSVLKYVNVKLLGDMGVDSPQ